MDPTGKHSTGMGDSWIEAARDHAMEGKKAVSKGDCLAAIGLGLVDAGGAMVKKLVGGLMGKVSGQVHEESARALDVVAKAVLGLFDSDSLKTQEDRKNLGTMESLAKEILGLQRDPNVPLEAKAKLDNWLRTANVIVQKGRPHDADKELSALQAAVRRIQLKPETDLRDIQAEWQNANKRKVRKESNDELEIMARALISRSFSTGSAAPIGIRGRATIGDQNPNVPRPGNPPRPPKPV